MARRRAGVPAEVVQLVADVRDLGGGHDLPVGGRRGIDVDHRDEVGTVDTGALVQRSDVDIALRRLLARHLRRGVAGPVVLVIAVAHRRVSFFAAWLYAAL